MSGMAVSAASLAASGLPVLSSAATLTPLPALQLSKGAKAAREFEGQLIGMVLESMEKTFAALPGESAIAGEDDYNYLGTRAMATAMAEAGGFGIAKMITEHLPAEPERHTKVVPGGS